jgi:protoheme IX farnesyltransferase
MVSARTYYRLTKPGIVYGNVFHAAVGVLLAHASGLTLLWSGGGLILGITAVIASACVANNIMDRRIDSKMARTKKRAMVIGQIETPSAVLFALVLLTVGVTVLVRTTNFLTVILCLVAYIWYVWIYGWAKRTTWWSTVIGTVPGAIPIMAGYTAVTNHLDASAWLLFAMLVLWQLPHFYAIALYREKEYRAAKLPIISVSLGRHQTWRQMAVYGTLYVLSLVGLVIAQTFALIPGLIVLAAGAYWLVIIFRGRTQVSDTWARHVFRLSLLLTIVLFVASSITVVIS